MSSSFLNLQPIFWKRNELGFYEVVQSTLSKVLL